jgi:hypothetical protein
VNEQLFYGLGCYLRQRGFVYYSTIYKWPVAEHKKCVEEACPWVRREGCTGYASDRDHVQCMVEWNDLYFPLLNLSLQSYKTYNVNTGYCIKGRQKQTNEKISTIQKCLTSGGRWHNLAMAMLRQYNLLSDVDAVVMNLGLHYSFDNDAKGELFHCYRVLLSEVGLLTENTARMIIYEMTPQHFPSPTGSFHEWMKLGTKPTNCSKIVDTVNGRWRVKVEQKAMSSFLQEHIAVESCRKLIYMSQYRAWAPLYYMHDFSGQDCTHFASVGWGTQFEPFASDVLAAMRV